MESTGDRTCPRCKKEFKSKAGFERHKNRKDPCKLAKPPTPPPASASTPETGGEVPSDSPSLVELLQKYKSAEPTQIRIDNFQQRLNQAEQTRSVQFMSQIIKQQVIIEALVDKVRLLKQILEQITVIFDTSPEEYGTDDEDE